MTSTDRLTPEQKTSWIKQKAKEYGFDQVGIAKAEFLSEEAEQLQAWLDQGYQGKMSYMENHFELRTDPTKLVDNAKSIICFSYNYYPANAEEDVKNKIAKYAYGRDYHKVIKKKLKVLYKEMQEAFGEFSGRFFVDSAPVMEREWAKRAGLGWVGKNTLIINPKKGSFFFLAEMIIDVELVYDNPISDYCGTCTKCITACPTDAILGDGYELDASKCISYLTIELKDKELPEEFKGKMEDWAFGCDICQDVCPWNRFSTVHDEPDFQQHESFLEIQQMNSEDLTKELFDEVFEGSAVKRTGYEGFVRNVSFLEQGPDSKD